MLLTGVVVADVFLGKSFLAQQLAVRVVDLQFQILIGIEDIFYDVAVPGPNKSYTSWVVYCSAWATWVTYLKSPFP